MPTSVNVNGKTIYVPGIYGYVDASALAGKGISTGNVAVVGSFPTFEQHAINWFTNPQALRNWDPSDLKLARLAKLLFAPASDDAVSGANAVLLINADTVTQASYTFKDAANVNSITVKSKKWGTKGNQVYFEMLANAGDPKLLDINVALAGSTESFLRVGSGDIASFTLDTTKCTDMGATASTSTITVNPGAGTQKLTWAFSNRLAAAGVPVAVPNVGPATTVTWTKMVVNGPVTVTPAKAAPAGCTISVAVTGKNTTGATVTGTVTFVNADGVAGKVVTDGVNNISWIEITSIALSSAAVNPDADTFISISGNAFDLSLPAFSKVTDLIASINNYAAKGWVATSLLPITAQIPSTEIDKVTTLNVKNVSAAVRADVWSIVQTLAASQIVQVVRHADAVNAPLPWNVAATSAAQTLLGGTETSVADFTTAFSQIETQDVQWVVPLSTNIVNLKAARQHCINAAIVGHERGAFGGAPANTSLANLLTNYTAALNSRHISVCGQEIQISGPTGAAEWLSPEYMAVQLAAMKAGTTVAEPLTNKKPDVLDFKGSWTAQVDDNEVIQKAIIAYTRGNIGIKVLRSVTTWLTDDNPAYSELSANESVNTNIRSLRANLESSVGQKANIPLSVFKAKVESLLAQQVADGIIYAWRNVVIEKIADKYRIDYDVAPIFPFNFAEIWAHVGDFEF